MYVSILVVVLALATASEGDRPTLTNADVIALVRAGVGDAVVLHAVESNPCRFDVSAGGLAELRRVGVTDSIIAAMTRARRKATAHLRLLDPGVYYKRTDAYALVESELIQWKATAANAEGFTRWRLVGEVQNTTTHLSLKTDGELLIVCRAGRDPCNYQLLRGETQAAWREFHAEAVVREGKVLALAGKGVRFEPDHTFDLGVRVPLRTLRPGEYGLVAADVFAEGQVAASGRIYTFTVE